MYHAQVIGEHHLPSTTAYPHKPKRVNIVRITGLKVFLFFFHPTASEGCIPIVPCHIMSYWEFNPSILCAFSGLFFSDGIYVFTNFCLGVFPTLDITQKFHIMLIAFMRCYFDFVGISFNNMDYFNQWIDHLPICTTHKSLVSTICQVIRPIHTNQR